MPKAGSEKLRILLVEDNPGDVELLRESLEEMGGGRFRIERITPTLNEALEALDAGRFDLVLLDLTLPDSTGLATFQQIHQRVPHTPVVVLSGLDDEEQAVHTVQEGAADYLVKGQIDARVLVRSMRYAVERARTQRQLDTERELVHALLENIPDRIYFKDAKSRFIRVNHAIVELFGLNSPEEAIGKSDFDFFTAEHAKPAFEDERKVMRTGEPIVGKIEKETMPNGAVGWVTTTKLPLRDHEGRIVGTFGISRDFSRIRQMEEALAAERNLLRNVIDNLPDPIYVKSVDGCYLLDNLAHHRFLGIEPGDSIFGRRITDYLPREIATMMHEEDLRLMRTGETLPNTELAITGPDGVLRHFLRTKVPLRDEKGGVRGLVGISRDITERKLAEDKLRTANRDLIQSREELLKAVSELKRAHEDLRTIQMQLIEAEKMKSIGRLAAGVAHEVKNPLGIISMGIDYLCQQQFADPESPGILKEMRDAVERGNAVIRGLLDFSAPKKLDVHPEDLNMVIEHALQMVKFETAGKRFNIVRELSQDLPPMNIDPLKLSQVLVNLFVNAFHSMGDEGTLTVRSRRTQWTGPGQLEARSDLFRPGDLLAVVEVEDTGPGISPEILPRIFEPFVTSKASSRGTGLGLSIAKTIIELHGGAIALSNRPPGGACATIALRL